jgi:hypothetical protein
MRKIAAPRFAAAHGSIDARLIVAMSGENTSALAVPRGIEPLFSG